MKIFILFDYPYECQDRIIKGVFKDKNTLENYIEDRIKKEFLEVIKRNGYTGENLENFIERETASFKEFRDQWFKKYLEDVEEHNLL